MPVDRTRLPDLGPAPVFTFPVIGHRRLANGLNVRTVEHHSVPVVTFVLLVEGGSGSDPATFEGLAALTADMLDEGTGDRSAIQVSEALAGIGADYDVEVGPDACVLSLTTLVRFADRGASLLADITTKPRFHDADFARVKSLRLDRLGQLKDQPAALAERGFLRLLYADHPYAHLSIGHDSSLRRLSLEDVVRFHQSTYQPARATLAVVGAMSHEELGRVAERAFGGWSAVGAPAATDPSRIATPTQERARLAVIPREGAAQSELRIGQLVARRDTPDYPALLAMNAVLGGQFVSRIMLKLREEKGFTYGARTGFDWRRGMAPFALHTSVHTVATAEAITDALVEFEALRAERPPTADEMVLVKASLTSGYPRSFETAQQVARSVVQLSLYGLPDSYFEAFTPTISAVTAEDVTAAAATYLDPSRMTTLIVGDHAAIGASLDALGLGPARVLDASD